jgi:hypothetical protein
VPPRDPPVHKFLLRRQVLGRPPCGNVALVVLQKLDAGFRKNARHAAKSISAERAESRAQTAGIAAPRSRNQLSSSH